MAIEKELFLINKMNNKEFFLILLLNIPVLFLFNITSSLLYEVHLFLFIMFLGNILFKKNIEELIKVEEKENLELAEVDIKNNIITFIDEYSNKINYKFQSTTDEKFNRYFVSYLDELVKDKTPINIQATKYKNNRYLFFMEDFLKEMRFQLTFYYFED